MRVPLVDFSLLLLAAHPSAALDDSALAERIRTGDAEAFRLFFERHHRALLHYVQKRGVSQEMSEDLVQQAFIRIWEHRAEIDPGQSLRAYIYRMVYTRALNHFRDTAKFTTAEVLDTQRSTDAPDQATEYGLMQEALHQAIATLPEKRRTVFELCFLQELTYREAAEVLGISPKTVEHQMSHALKTMRVALAPFRDA